MSFGLSAALAVVIVAPGTASAETPAPPSPTVDPRRARVLERAVAHVAHRPDVVEALDVGRGLTTAVFELSCAATLLIPEDGQLPWWDVALGVGCLAASVGLLVANGLRLARLRERAEARDRMARFREAAADGLDAGEADAFEGELHRAAADTRRTRAVGMTLGGASWVATGVLAWATATDRVEARAGTAIAVATFVAGALGLSLVFVESPAERASTAVERLGGSWGGRPTGLRLSLTPWGARDGAGVQLVGAW